MGNKQSSSSSAHPFRYDRLSSSSSETQQPLLDTVCNHEMMMDQLKRELWAELKKREAAFEKLNRAMETEIRELKSAMSKQEKGNKAMGTDILELKSAMSKHEKRNQSVGASSVDKDIKELRSALSRVESRLLPPTLVTTPPPTRARKSNMKDSEMVEFLKKEVDKVAKRVTELEVESLNELKKNADSEKKTMTLTTTIHKLNSAASVTNLLHQGPAAAPDMSDLMSCLVVLIFMTGILIGISL